MNIDRLPTEVGLSLDGCRFILSILPLGEDHCEWRCMLVPAGELSIPSIESVPFLADISDIKELGDYLNEHLCHLCKGGSSSRKSFIVESLGVEFQAMEGDIDNEDEGDFSLRIMLNVGFNEESSSRMYFGCETTVDVRATREFVKTLESVVSIGDRSDAPDIGAGSAEP